MSNKVLKELNQSKEKEFSKIEEDEVLNSAKQLLLESTNEDREILERLGLDHHLKYDTKLKQDYNRTKTIEKIYNKSTFSGKQIKRLCNLYNLRLLSVSKYNGTVPPELPRIIKEFCDEHKLAVSADSFFILAPVEQFKTVKHVPVNKDPILFYREGSNNRHNYKATLEDSFTQIYNWGNDFSNFRKFSILFSRYINDHDSTSNFWRSIIVIALLLLGTIISVTSGHLIFIISTILITIPIYLTTVYSGVSDTNKLWNSDKV